MLDQLAKIVEFISCEAVNVKAYYTLQMSVPISLTTNLNPRQQRSNKPLVVESMPRCQVRQVTVVDLAECALVVQLWRRLTPTASMKALLRLDDEDPKKFDSN